MPASPSRALIPATAAIVAIAALLAVLGSSVLGGSGTPTGSASPTAPPSAAPSAPVSTPEPSAAGGDSVVLNDPTGHVITVDVEDRSGSVTQVGSSRPIVGMSVRWGVAVVENVDETTVRVTWAGYPRDEVVAATVDRDGPGFAVRIGQVMPYPNTDAMGQDRILVLSFAQPVAAADVAVVIEDPAS